MCDITAENFEEKITEIKNDLSECKFITLDLEFSALYPLDNEQPSLFDTPAQRYSKLRKNVQCTIPLQIGLSAFYFDANADSYYAKTYNFYVKPAVFTDIDFSFFFKGSSLEFLKLHNFDLNKFLNVGVPYINKIQESKLKEKLNNVIDEIDFNFNYFFHEIVDIYSEIVKNWYNKTSEVSLSLPELSQKINHNLELKYRLHKYFRKTFKNVLTYETDGVFILKKVTSDEFTKHDQNFEAKFLQEITGFLQIYKILTNLNKPIVGHNALLDVLIMINCFEGNLPYSYKEFKNLANELFPSIYDTKHICYALKRDIPEKQRWENSDLKYLFNFFKNGIGRHLAINSPMVEFKYAQTFNQQFHNAGWDSYCTGYIFIRLAFLNVKKNYPKYKKIMFSEYIKGLEGYRNRLNMIRGSINHVFLGGADPETTKPPYLFAESKSLGLNVKQLHGLLNAYGSVEIKPYGWRNRAALVAVDNYASARSILCGFKGHPEIKIQRYDVIRHSPYFKAFLWGSVGLSGALAIYLVRNVVNNN